MTWDVKNLETTAFGISASRRTDIPGLFAPWFDNRLTEGFADYIPAGPPRRIRRSLLPQDVTHFNFWTKWPRPFFRVLGRVLEMGYPVLWNVTVTGLGQTEVEENVPPAEKVVRGIQELASFVPPSAIQWRYDPIFLSEKYSESFHVATFQRLAEQLAGYVDRVAVSVVECYSRRVKPDLKLYQIETGDQCIDLPLNRQVDLVDRLNDIAASLQMKLTVCCSPELRQATGCPASGCNSFDWACRVYPSLREFRRLKKKPTRADCACSQEVDIGAYDTCTFNCRYSYGSCNYQRALDNFAKHDPMSPCLIPGE